MSNQTNPRPTRPDSTRCRFSCATGQRAPAPVAAFEDGRSDRRGGTKRSRRPSEGPAHRGTTGTVAAEGGFAYASSGRPPERTRPAFGDDEDTRTGSSSLMHW